MSETAPPQDTPPRGPAWKRYLWVGGSFAVVAALFFVIFWPSIEISVAINGLHSEDPASRRAQLEKLKHYEDKEFVIDKLLEAVQDDGRSFEVRMMCAHLLIDHFDRVGRLDPLLKTGSLSTRGVVLKSLSLKNFFVETYVEDPAYRVRETIFEWLRNPQDLTRRHAIQLAVKLDLKEALPDILPLLARSGSANVHARDERDLMIAAAGALERFKHCEKAGVLLAGAQTDPDSLVRLRFMQILDRMVFRVQPPAPCKGVVEEAPMRALVQKALDDKDHSVRMGAMLILARQPAWAKGVAERIEGILGGAATGPERRHALEVLVALGDPAFLDRFPRYFHDGNRDVRSTALYSAATIKEPRFDGCLIGLVGAESEDSNLFRDALGVLARNAGRRVGFPRSLTAKEQTKDVKDLSSFNADLETLFSRGQVDDVTRDGVAEAWFRWWCAELELTAAQTEEAVTVRKAFWQAMDRRDVPAAQAALQGLTTEAPGLFAYERGWLQSREGN